MLSENRIEEFLIKIGCIDDSLQSINSNLHSLVKVLNDIKEIIERGK